MIIRKNNILMKKTVMRMRRDPLKMVRLRIISLPMISLSQEFKILSFIHILGNDLRLAIPCSSN